MLSYTPVHVPHVHFHMLSCTPLQLTVNHVVVSTTAHKMWPQEKAAGEVMKSGQK